MAARPRPIGRNDTDPPRSRSLEEQIDDVVAAKRGGRPGADSVGDHSRLVAHELRGHVAVLDGYLSMLEDGTLGELPERAAGVLPELRGKTHAISHLIDDMLEDARLEDGGIHLVRRVIDLREIVNQAVDEARLTLPATHALIATVPFSPVMAVADARRIAIILRNLLDNAVKYSPQGGRVECHLELEMDRAVIYVSDEGIGIDPEDSDVVFRRFGRGHRPDAPPGVGLGLYICRRLAELHGGQIEMRPRPGEGTVFRVTLPLSN